MRLFIYYVLLYLNVLCVIYGFRTHGNAFLLALSITAVISISIIIQTVNQSNKK